MGSDATAGTGWPRRLSVALVCLVVFACDGAPEPTDRARGPAGTARPAAAEGAGAPLGARSTARAEPAEPTPPRALPPVRLELDLAARLVLRIAEHDAHLDAVRLDARTIRVEARTADVTALDALCASEPAHCEDAIDAWAERLSRGVDTATEHSLAAILVPSVEVEAARASAREAGLPEPVVGRRWVEPFFLSIVSVEPDVIRQLEPPDLVALGGRDADALEALALANLASEILATDPAALVHEPASAEHAPNVRVIHANDGLSTSRLLLVDRWRPLTGPSGTLYAAAPTAHTLLFTASAETLDLATLAYLARRVFAAEPAPVSPAVLRLTASGWALDSLNDRPDPARDAALEAVYGAPSD